jgi:DNA repair protein RecN (Recombination protein N)
MLTSLYIQNYALIDKLDIAFGPGFSVITGETGAGKSILLGAIGLLLGQRADSHAIKTGASRCVIEAHFDLSGYGMDTFFVDNDFDFDGKQCTIRRELTSTGKSRAFINDTPAQLTQLKVLGEKLIDIHSQHQNLMLSEENFQLDVLDIIANDKEKLNAYSIAFKNYREAEQALQVAKEDIAKNRADEDFLRFQLNQLDEAKLSPTDQTDLEQEASILSHAEEIKQALYGASTLLDGADDETVAPIVSQLKNCTNTLTSINELFPAVKELTARVESCYIELKDITDELNHQEESVDFDPDRLNLVNERLNTIYSLEQKHKVSSVPELIAIGDEMREKITAIDTGDEHITELEKQLNSLLAEARRQAEQITKVRTKAAQQVESQMRERLIPLGIPNVQFKVALTTRKTLDRQGADKVEFLFCANKNGTLQNVSQVASGGEIARVMLSLKAMIAGAVMLPTIIFDEIDTGVSGAIAEKMAEIMAEMGRSKRQVISITHLPQIAAKGSRHYMVYKKDDETGTSSHIIELTQEERITEIAHMLSGATLTDAAISNAKELLHIK